MRIRDINKENISILTPVRFPPIEQRISKKHGNLIGKIFDRLTVIDYIGVNRKDETLWQCICICGNKTIGISRTLIYNQKRSCGCLRLDNYRKVAVKDLEKVGTLAVYTQYKRNAKVRNFEFNINIETFYKFIKQNCFYCNSSLSNFKDCRLGRKFWYNGIDRIDSNKSYDLNNIITCCYTCNQMKWDYDYSFFIKHIEKIYVTSIKKN